MAETPSPTPAPINTTTLGGKTVYDCAPSVLANYFEMHTGSRAGIGEFLLTRGDYAALVGDDGAGEGGTTAKLVMKASDGSTGVELDVVIGGWMPFSTDVTGDDPNDVVKVVVYDKRCRRTEGMNKFFNVQREGFPGGSPPDPEDFYDSTLNDDDVWTWADLVSSLEIPGNPTLPAAPSWKPRNIIFDGVPFGRVIDDVAARLFIVVGYKWTVDEYTLDAPGTQASDNDTVETAAEGHQIGSTANSKRNPKRIPGKIYVRFKVNAPPGTDDPYSADNRYYEKLVENAAGDASSKAVLNVGEYIAVRDTGSGGGYVNQSELDAVAADVAVRHLNFVKQVIGSQAYAGMWPFRPDGKIRGVRWSTTRAGATTTVRYNNDRDWNAMMDTRRGVDALSNQLVVGYGETFVTLGLGGTRYVKGGGSDIVRVRLEHTGDDKYAVYSWGVGDPIPEDAEPIAENAEPIAGRPFGVDLDIVVHATKGLAWREEGEIVLIFALGEEYALADCEDEEEGE